MSHDIRHGQRVSDATKRADRKASVQCEGLEDRQLLTHGFGAGFPGAMAGFGPMNTGATAQTTPWRSWDGRGAQVGATGMGAFARQNMGQAGALQAQAGGQSGLASPFAGQQGGGMGMGMGRAGRFGGVGAAGRFGPHATLAAQANFAQAPPDVTATTATATAAPTDVPFSPIDTATASATPLAPPMSVLPFAPQNATDVSTGETASATPPKNVFADSAVQTAAQELQQVLDPIFAAKRPTHASIGALMDDQEAIAAGTLTGDEADAKLKADYTAILTSAGATQEQIDSALEKWTALNDAITAAGGDPNTLPPLGLMMGHAPGRPVAPTDQGTSTATPFPGADPGFDGPEFGGGAGFGGGFHHGPGGFRGPGYGF